ncbi:ABC transporter permease [Candidatus Poribacteria bacterium]|nr:ABC transporter permease [Candidatus Poribacteria bacterium]
MKLYHISLNNLRRRKSKTIFLAIGLIIGIATTVSLIMITRMMNEDIAQKLDEYGANILIVPKSDGLTLSYGGMTIGGLSFDMQQLHESDVDKINTIHHRENISTIAPKLVGAVKVEGGRWKAEGGRRKVEGERQKAEVEHAAPLHGISLRSTGLLVASASEANHKTKSLVVSRSPERSEGEANSGRQKPTSQPTDALLVGVRFEDEFKIKKWWEISGTKPGRETEILLGSEAAAKLQAEIGDVLKINGQPVWVAGELKETGSQDDEFIFADLKTAQEILEQPEALSLVEVSALCNTCPIEEIVAQISAALPQAKVTAIKQAVKSKMDTLDRFKRFSSGIAAIVLLIGCLIVFTNMMAAVNERTREIGVFRAIGFRKTHIISIILLEAFLLGLFSGLAGFLISVFVSRYAAQAIAEVTLAKLNFSPTLAVLSLCLGVALGMLSSLYPALRAAKLEPMEALRAL